ncbi:MAG: PilW family protein, partial [Pseudomonadota bacterium]|nr:PilW family protein [Pseudomonadota bacterium]
DVIVVRYASPNTTAVTSGSGDTITLATSVNAKNGDPFIISDCQHADIFTAVTGNNKNGNVTTIKLNAGALNKTYGADAEVAPLKYVAYYIRKSDGHNNLYRNVVNGVAGKLEVQNAEPLLEGVEDLQVLYGEDLDGDGSKIRYVAADTADLDMKHVTSVRLSLLLSSVDNNLTSGDQKYWLNGELKTVANDKNSGKKLLRSFTTTIKVRNKGIGL